MGNLVISRRTDESMVIETSDGPIVIKAVDFRKQGHHQVDSVRLAINAPQSCTIVRTELINPDQENKLSDSQVALITG